MQFLCGLRPNNPHVFLLAELLKSMLCKVPCLLAVIPLVSQWGSSIQGLGDLLASVTNSATGTRTRVARVRAEYPNQLDYGGHGDKENVSYFDLRCLVRKPGAWEFHSLRLGVCGNTLDGSSLDTFGCGHVGKQSPLQRRPGTTRGSRKREKSQRLTISVSSTSSSLFHSVHTRSRTWVVAATTRRPSH